MDAEVIAAIIAAVASILAAGVSYQRSRSAAKSATQSSERLAILKSELFDRQQLMLRRLDAEQIISRYREPLATAAFDLQSRLRNILDDGFLSYLSRGPSRKKEALESTTFRVAQYFGWTEALRQSIQFFDFSEPERSQQVSSSIKKVSILWATDRIYGEHLMIWFEAQRAVGELMLVEKERLVSVMGFADFTSAVDDFDPWLAHLKAALAPIPFS